MESKWTFDRIARGKRLNQELPQICLSNTNEKFDTF